MLHPHQTVGDLTRDGLVISGKAPSLRTLTTEKHARGAHTVRPVKTKIACWSGVRTEERGNSLNPLQQSIFKTRSSNPLPRSWLRSKTPIQPKQFKKYKSFNLYSLGRINTSRLAPYSTFCLVRFLILHSCSFQRAATSPAFFSTIKLDPLGKLLIYPKWVPTGNGHLMLKQFNRILHISSIYL